MGRRAGRSGLRVFGALLTAAMAFSPLVAQGTAAKFDCDTAAGSFSEIDFSQPGPRYHVSGNVSAKQFRYNGTWIPVANVRIVSADKQSFGGVRLQATTGRGGLELIVQSRVQGRDNSMVVATLRKGELATFSLDVVDGKMTIRVADKLFSGPEIGAGSAVNVTCSSGQFIFQNLNWDAQP